MQKTHKVLIVDDSAVVRQALTDVLSSDPQIDVIGAASDPFIAAEKIRRKAPDVIVLDVEMPRMDGLTFLQKIMSQHPLPVVMCSSLTTQGSETALKAFQYGAVDVIAKPRAALQEFFEESRVLICDTVKAAASAQLGVLKRQQQAVPPKLTADAIMATPKKCASVETTERIIAIGASTGGTEALRVFLEQLPPESPGIVIVQHMPAHFTGAFARRLDTLCRVSIKEAENGDPVLPGTVLIAPGDRHLLLKRRGAHYLVETREGPLVSRHRPSVDVLFRSVARYAGKNAIGVIMTGMGDDGARGMLEMREAGAMNFAQDEATSVVFGMPKEAIRHGGVDKVLSLERLASAVLAGAKCQGENGSQKSR